MSSNVQLQSLPRVFVRTWLRAARLPLDAVESITHRGDHEAEWPPALAFESFEAQCKQVAGAVLRDETLVEEGRLIQAKVAELRKAAELETVAQRRTATAAAKQKAVAEAADQQRRRAERVAQEREQALERDVRAKQREVEAEFAAREDAASEASETARRALERRERDAARTRIDGDQAVLRKERNAVAAKRRAVDADKKIEASTAARKARRQPR
jgi:hypothetical protein